MISVVRDKDGNIKTFQQSLLEDYNRSLGESIEYVDASMSEYAGRFYLACNGRSGETILAYQSGPDLRIDVSCPGEEEVEVMVNNLREKVKLEQGKGHFLLSTANWGIFVIEPADRRKYCAAGNGKLCLEVMPYV